MNDIDAVRILILEDDIRFIEKIESHLEEIDKVVYHSVQSVDEAKELLYKRQFDLFLLDINLGEKSRIDGIDFALQLRKEYTDPAIIFITNLFDQDHYSKAIECAPIAFMDKNISTIKLQQAIELGFYRWKGVKIEEEKESEKQAINHIHHDKLFFRVGNYFKAIDTKDILYFEAQGNTIVAHSEANRSYPTSVQLKTIEKELFPNFLRCHKSFVVNVGAIMEINPGEAMIVIQGNEIPIGYTYKKDFFRNLNLLK